ncbi:hypothetical protein LCGC14_0945420 [marine sediment metagenome]|uniref:Uncharacterized protein n=1 Tax=marine sediment metagenome TaxID=412755 RepID=A0A0F9NIW1_9ZZZZ
MAKEKGTTVWGAYHKDLEILLRDIVLKLDQIGIPSPTKKEASALIAHRQTNNLTFMKDKEIKEFILHLRGF